MSHHSVNRTHRRTLNRRQSGMVAVHVELRPSPMDIMEYRDIAIWMETTVLWRPRLQLLMSTVYSSSENECWKVIQNVFSILLVGYSICSIMRKIVYYICNTVCFALKPTATNVWEFFVRLALVKASVDNYPVLSWWVAAGNQLRCVASVNLPVASKWCVRWIYLTIGWECLAMGMVFRRWVVLCSVQLVLLTDLRPLTFSAEKQCENSTISCYIQFLTWKIL